MKWKLLPLFLMILCLVGCAAFSKARLSHLQQIHVGQSDKEVESVLGRPDRVVAGGSSQAWHYRLFSEDSSRTYPYIALIENGILKSIHPGSDQNSEDRKLCLERKKSDQTLIPFAGGNDAPPMKVESCGD